MYLTPKQQERKANKEQFCEVVNQYGEEIYLTTNEFDAIIKDNLPLPTVNQ